MFSKVTLAPYFTPANKRLADEQATLRHMAALVSCGEQASVIFEAVAGEVCLFSGARMTRLVHYLTGETAEVVGAWGGAGALWPVGTQWKTEGGGVQFLETHGLRSIVSRPIMVGGACWGVMLAYGTDRWLLSDKARSRVGEITNLMVPVIACAQAHADLAASHARVAAASTQVRQQIKRDLHDGIQQRLVSLILQVRGIEREIPSGIAELGAGLSHVADELTDVLSNVGQIARGAYPTILARGGLGAAIRSLTRHCPMRVQLNVRVPARLPEAVEVVAYYVAAESLANTMKYAKASVVHVDADTPNGNRLRLTVRDDGVGGADPARGTGLLGLIERVEALNGTIKIESPTGEGTVLQVELPIPIHDAEPVG